MLKLVLDLSTNESHNVVLEDISETQFLIVIRETGCSFDVRREGFCLVALKKLELERLSWVFLRLGISFVIFVLV